METALVAQQAQLQTNVALSMIKKNAQADQKLINTIAQAVQSAPTAGRGSLLDVTV